MIMTKDIANLSFSTSATAAKMLLDQRRARRAQGIIRGAAQDHSVATLRVIWLIPGTTDGLNPSLFSSSQGSLHITCSGTDMLIALTLSLVTFLNH